MILENYSEEVSYCLLLLLWAKTSLCFHNILITILLCEKWSHTMYI